MRDFAVDVRALGPPSWLVNCPATLRDAVVSELTSISLDVIDGCAPFDLATVPDAELMRKHPDGRGIAGRRCDTSVGVDDVIAESLR